MVEEQRRLDQLELHDAQHAAIVARRCRRARRSPGPAQRRAPLGEFHRARRRRRTARSRRQDAAAPGNRRLRAASPPRGCNSPSNRMSAYSPSVAMLETNGWIIIRRPRCRRDRLAEADSVGPGRRRGNRRLHDQSRDAEASAAAARRRCRARRPRRSSTVGTPLSASWVEIGLVAVPPQQAGGLTTGSCSASKRLSSAQPRPVVVMVSPGDQRQDQIVADKSPGSVHGSGSTVAPRRRKRCGLDVIGPVPRLRIIRRGDQDRDAHRQRASRMRAWLAICASIDALTLPSAPGARDQLAELVDPRALGRRSTRRPRRRGSLPRVRDRNSIRSCSKSRARPAVSSRSH